MANLQNESLDLPTDLGGRFAWEFPNRAVLNLVVCNFYAKALFWALLRPFGALLRLRSFALFCAHLRVSASDRV